MAKKALVVLADGFEEIEAVTTIDILRRAGIDVTVAGLGKTQIRGSHGITITADNKVDEAGADFDAIILPGGMPGAKNLAGSEKVKGLIAKMHSEGKLIAAICASPAVVLAQTGILKNKSATCYPGMEGNFGKDTKYRGDNVVIDGNIITSRGPATAFLFSLGIAEKLAGKESRDKLERETLLSS